MGIKNISIAIILLFAHGLVSFGQIAIKPSIEVKNSKVYLSGTEISLPVAKTDLEKLLGRPNRTFDGARRVSTWDDHGLIAYQKLGESAYIEIGVILDIKENSFEFSPRTPFRGSFIIDGAKVTNASSLTSINRQKKGAKFKPIPLVNVLSEYASKKLYLVMWQTGKSRPITNAKILQIAIAIKPD